MTTATTIDAEKSRVEFVVRLEEIQQFFAAPDLDPFVDQARVTAGIDDIVAYLNTIPMRKAPAVKTTLVLPADQLTPDLKAHTQAAIVRYCDFRLEEIRRTMAASHFEWRAKLPVGLLVAVAAVIAFGLIIFLSPDFLKNWLVVFTPVVTVTVWVSIWNPVETLLYDRWDDRRDFQVYSAIKAMAIEVKTG
jgi:hypothetical protein